MITVLTALVYLVGVVVCIGTLLPLTSSVRWWVRAWEFPRLHIAVAALAVVVVCIFIPMPGQPWFSLALALCLIFHGVQIFPYTRWAKPEIEYIKDIPFEKQIKLLAANVLMENTRTGDMIAILDREDPDVLLLMETDQPWLDAMEPVLQRYSTVVRYPLDNHYGLVFATRLRARTAEIMFLSDDNTPSVQAELYSPAGKGFNFIGLHPRPPVPGNDTKLRDLQIKRAAEHTGDADWPTVCMGDFNDVAWSWTSRRFKRYGNYLEPRVGRGMLSTFHAQHIWMRVPIDQVYMTKGIGLVSFARLEEFGSDHFPISATITV